MGWGLMEAHYYKFMKEGNFKDASFNNIFLQNCINHDTVIRILGNVYDNERLLMVD